VTGSIWLRSHVNHWFSQKSVPEGPSHGVVIRAVIFFKTSAGTAMGTGPMCPCAVPRIMLGALTIGSHTHIVIWPMHLGYVCLRVVIELVTVTRCSHLLILTNCSHMFLLNFRSSSSRLHFVERKMFTTAIYFDLTGKVSLVIWAHEWEEVPSLVLLGFVRSQNKVGLYDYNIT
jgi:hypothetical protein